MPAVDETEVDIALTKNSLEKNDMVGEEKRKVTNNHLLVTFFSVEHRGFEPLTYRLRTYRSTNWANTPWCKPTGTTPFGIAKVAIIFK